MDLRLADNWTHLSYSEDETRTGGNERPNQFFGQDILDAWFGSGNLCTYATTYENWKVWLCSFYSLSRSHTRIE